jgi:hypothetical protein
MGIKYQTIIKDKKKENGTEGRRRHLENLKGNHKKNSQNINLGGGREGAP